MGFKVISDGSCDLRDDLIKLHNIDVVPFYVSFDGVNYLKEKEEIDVLEFYKKMVDNPGVFPKTSMPTVEDYIVKFKKYAMQNIDVMCICITRKFSSSFDSASTARLEVLKEFPKAKIEVVDATINTCIQGLLVLEAARMSEEGYSLFESIEMVDRIKKTARIFFTIGNMDYLKHGGRIGKLKSLIGATLKIKPIIVLKEGEIFPNGLTFTRKQSILKVVSSAVKHFEDNNLDSKNYLFILGCGYNQDEITSFKEKFEAKFPGITFLTGQIGATIGVHTGPYPLGLGIIEKFDAGVKNNE